MKLKNSFDQDELIKWFVFNKSCWWCLRQHADSFHHVDGRSSNSILNAAPINNLECHLPNHPKLYLKKNKIMLLQMTYDYLIAQDYKLNKKDKEFIQKHLDLYPWMLN